MSAFIGTNLGTLDAGGEATSCEAHPHWGARKLLKVLATKHPRITQWPVASTVANLLARRGLVQHRRRRRRMKLGGVFGGLVFPSESDPRAPIRTDVFANWLKAAEAKAELPKLDGSLWHAYRRSWATARKNLPVADVAAAGGWSDLNTLLRCYQQVDEDTLLAVMNEPRKVTERASSA